MTITNVTQAGLKRIAQHEGNVLTAYRDSVGVWTIGRGHTGPDARQGNTITEERSMALFIADIAEAEATIEHNLPANIVTEIREHAGAWDALVSIVFNIGPKLFRNANGGRTGIWRALTERRYDDVPAEIRRWDKGRVNGEMRAIKGLTTRRADEATHWAAAFQSAPTEHVAEGEAGIVPDEPETPRPIASTKTVTGAVVSGAAGAAAVGQQVSEAAQSAGAFAQPGTWLWSLVGILIVVGVALTIYGRIKVRQRTGE